MKISDILKIVNGKPLNLLEDIEIKQFIIDSRKVKEGDFFIPLKGSTDGHNYIEDALKNKAAGYLTEKPKEYKNGILVDDTYKALLEIAKHKRKKINTVVGITGTSGKTSTKELINHVLSHLTKSYATVGNYNNEIGVPLTLANVPEDIDIAIIEIGAGKVGDIDYLNSIVKQDIGVLVSVGYGHTAKFGSFENVIKGKGEIFNNTKYNVLPEDLKIYYKDIKNAITYGEKGDIEIFNIKITKEGTEGTIKYKNDSINLTLPFYNVGVFKNIGAVASVLFHLGFNPIKNLDFLKDFELPEGRGKILKIKDLTIIDETYNANPLSVKNSIETLNQLEGINIIILGDMLELGEYSKNLHREIGKFLLDKKIDYVFLYGDNVKYIHQETKDFIKSKIFEKKEDIAKEIEKLSSLKPNILIKGSRSMKMEEVIEYLK